MTLAPLVHHAISGVAGDAYRVSERCAVPGCARRAEQAHHAWPRSYLKRDYDWVRLPSERVIGNRIPICVLHHEPVTSPVGGHKARIRLGEDETLLWDERGADGGWEFVGPLNPQPPVAGQQEWERIEEPLVCPACGHVRHPHTHEPAERRPSKTWTVTVPQDAELGSVVLDDFVDDLALVIGAAHWTSRLKRYHVLAVVLAWASQRRTELLADVEEAARS